MEVKGESKRGKKRKSGQKRKTKGPASGNSDGEKK